MYMGVRIVLVEPAGPLNVGSVARVIKNMGLSQLVLVNPQCDHLSQEAQQMAVHGVDILEKAQVVATIPDALVGCQRAIATTARSRAIPTTLEHPRTALPWLLSAGVTSALIFGPESRGLSNDELNHAQRFVRIPTSSTYPVLNLAQAVTVCCYELYQYQLYQSTHQPSPVPSQPLSPAPPYQDSAPLDQIERYSNHLEALLLKIGYLYPHTKTARMEKLRRLLNRATPTTEEINMLRGMLRQVEWALQFLPKSGVDDPSKPNQS
ncbi:RNA methyltransferase [Moorena producens PAL-8-15-08-1]|uniref:tRNA (cytidine/uridine-2'-O-)-methyltransferase TrmJ n=1 Tax=Moorena producens PAL-8-15-08-1 TaxID=1458985 RepID=A0A1D8U3M8_9CYAN|nr:RNA methyltransferase [Moorena producens]AOX04475.1 RNA methyltransferase [Moorena producens PAL-8-15-08-1]